MASRRDVILRNGGRSLHCGGIVALMHCAWWQETAEFNQILLPHTTQGHSVQEYWGIDSKKIQNSKHVDFISKEIERMFFEDEKGILGN